MAAPLGAFVDSFLNRLFLSRIGAMGGFRCGWRPLKSRRLHAIHSWLRELLREE